VGSSQERYACDSKKCGGYCGRDCAPGMAAEGVANATERAGKMLRFACVLSPLLLYRVDADVYAQIFHSAIPIRLSKSTKNTNTITKCEYHESASGHTHAGHTTRSKLA
jgi:hypothetical protein